ncbi:MAG: SCO1664 family protein [Actinomyces sp.]|nr:MAG: SCO1664 family protein [Actinomyces sp.]
MTAALALLEGADVELVGRVADSSNATFVVTLDGEHRAIYKPVRGERPLWDFPPGLHRRERAAHVLDRALGWDLVPPTVVRDDLPLGPGSLQWFVDADFRHHYFTLRDEPAHRRAFERICAFDVVVNNTDRKSGHCLVDDTGRIWAIDHGLTFHAEFKLRTVIWDFADQPLPGDVTDDLCRLLDTGLPEELGELLDPIERDAVRTRARALVTRGRFPVDTTGRRWPWPLV